MSYFTAFLDNARKFDVATTPGKREGTIQVEINTLDRITLVITPEQAKILGRSINKELPFAEGEVARGTKKPTQRQPGDDDIDF